MAGPNIKPKVNQIYYDLGQQFAKLRRFCSKSCGRANPDAIHWFNASRSRAIRNVVGLVGTSTWQPNVFPLIKLALSLLRQLTYHIMKNDTAPGYTFIYTHLLHQVEVQSNPMSYTKGASAKKKKKNKLTYMVQAVVSLNR